MTNKKWKITFTIITAVLAILIIGLYIFILPYVKNKVTDYVNENTTYNLKIESMRFSGFSAITISGIEFRPKLNVKEFYKADSIERDWIAVKLDKIVIGKIHWWPLIKDKNFIADRLLLNNADVYVLRDKRQPNGTPKNVLPPYRLIKDMKALITLPQTEISRAKIEYYEIAEDGAAASIRFSKLYGLLEHFSTDSLYHIQHPYMTLTGRGRILDHISGNMTCAFSMLDNSYEFEGITHAFPAKHLNQCLMPLAHAKVTNGEIGDMQVKFKVDGQVSKGTMQVDYKDLKVEVLQKDNDKKTLESAAANFLLRNNNDGRKNPGEIYFIFRKDRFVFTCWWGSIKAGFLSSALAKPVVAMEKKSDKKKKRKKKN